MSKRKSIKYRLLTCIVAAIAIVFLLFPSFSQNNESLDIPAYSDEPIITINSNRPFFTDDEIDQASISYEEYGDIDELGRCTYAIASVSSDTMPTEKREDLKIKPTGWKQKMYEGIIEDDALYNRCHLIAYSLTAENNNRNNLVTGTAYMNENMNYYEVIVAKYLDNHPNNHVLYRATPIFNGDDLLCQGILIEADSIEDNDIEFCVFVYNVQPGIILDYSDGSSYIE